MRITKLEPLTKTRWKVELDGEVTFVLYKGEVKRFGIREGEELPEEAYEQICREVLLKRAKLRAMHLLTDMARTEAGLREKLKNGCYPEPIIDEAVSYVKSFGYLDDYRYAEHFIESRRTTKSRREIGALLSEKGVPRELADMAMEACYGDEGDGMAIRRLIEKKRVDVTGASGEELHKLYGYLARKGFRYEDIRQVIQNYDENA